MTSAEAAEMKKLKESTVERLKSEMKILCGSITVSNQRRVLPSLSVSYEDLLGVPERAEEERSPSRDAPMRQCSNANRSGNGGNWAGNSAPYTDGLSQALSNYNLVNRPAPLSAHSNEKKKYSESRTNKHDGGPPVMVPSRAQNFKPLFTSQPTGFTICRPQGSFLWPSMLNVTQALPTNNPPMSRQQQTVDSRVLEGGTGDVSSGMPMSSPMVPVSHSIRSIAESKVAATMATMFGCMAMAPPISLPTLPLMTSEVDTARSNLGQCSFLGAEQSNPALSLSLSLSVSPGISPAGHK